MRKDRSSGLAGASAFFTAPALLLALLTLAPFAASLPALAQQPQPAATSAAAPDAARIVQRMVERNQQRAEALRGYTEIRHYTVDYRGFPPLRASITVEAIYTAPSTKTFRILSRSGPSFLIDAVLKRLLASEAEAARDPAAASITPANYTFTLAGTSTAEGRPCYLLDAQPRENSKFLFRGQICVDAADYAIIRIDAEPAHNPSFWIRKTEIHHLYGKTGEFWLPLQNQSRTSVRLGGTAVLTIDYGTPRIESAPASTTADATRPAAGDAIPAARR